MPSYRAPFLRAWRTGGTAVVIHLDRTSNDSDTSFPSRVSIFFTTTVLEELELVLVLLWLKEPELLPEPTLVLEAQAVVEVAIVEVLVIWAQPPE